MIEPHSAQLGASSWILKATFALPVAAWPLAATTANSSRAGEEAPLETEPAAATMVLATDAPTFGVPAAKDGEPAPPDAASSFKAVAVGASLAADVPPPAVGGSS